MVTWLRRWRVALHLARRDARRSRGRTALVVAMVGLPLMIAAGAFTIYRSGYPGDEVYVQQKLGSTLQASINLTSSQITQDVRGEVSFGTALDAPLTRPEAIAAIRSAVPAGDTVTESVSGQVRSHTADGRVGRDPYTEVDPAVIASYGAPAEGRLGTAPGEAVVDQWNLELLGVAVGDTVDVTWDADAASVPVQIVGTFSTEWRSPFYGVLAVPGTLPQQWSDAQTEVMYYVTGDQPVPWSAAAGLNNRGLALLSRDAVLNPPPGAPLGSGPYGAFNTSGDGQGFIIGVVVVAVLLLEVVMIIGPAFAVGARRSRRTLALMGVSGADPRQLRRVVTASGAFQGGMSAVVGIVLGIAVAAVLFYTVNFDTPNFVVPWELMAVLAVLGVLLGAAAAWFPARAAARTDLVAALAGRAATPLSSRRTGWIGLVVFVLGVVGLVAGSILAKSVIAIVGAFVALVGVVAASGSIVSVVARLAPHMGVASRLALRDAVRNRSRTAPALAAVIACAAGGTFAVVYVDASERAEDALWTDGVGPGRIVIASQSWGSTTLGDADAEMQAAIAATTKQYPGTQFQPVRFATHTDGDAQWIVGLEEDRSRCTDKAEARSRWTASYCRAGGLHTFSAGPWYADRGERVDDGSTMRALGFPDGEGAAQALEQGRILTHNPLAIDSHGMVKVRVESWSESSGESAVVKEVAVPGHYVPWVDSAYEIIMPPAVAEQLGLDEVQTIGYVGVPALPLGAQERRSVLALADDYRDLSVDLTVAPEPPNPMINIGIVAAALLVAAGATWIAAGLAAADSRADLATMSAVGASPGTRRRFAGAQAAVIAVIGTCIGVAAGMGVAMALIAVQNSLPADPLPLLWTMNPPWDVLAAFLVGVPAVAAGLVMLFTRARMPVVRRLA